MNAAPPLRDFASWRRQARDYLAAGVEPAAAVWADASAAQLGLLETPPALRPVGGKAPTAAVPAAFIELAEKVACHADPEKYALLYHALWRLTRGEKHLLSLSTDPLVLRLLRMGRQVSRDAHKTKAFVRFRKIGEQAGRECFVAWHCPDHDVLPLVGPFFQRRFGPMNWAILTPRQSVSWDGQALVYGPGARAEDAPAEDALEDAWRVFYRAIFNPARIKLKMMRQEMPVRHWKTMPETAIISDMLREAPARVAEMLKHQEGFAKSAADFIPAAADLPMLRQAARGCEGCPLHCNATQTVFGIGPETSPLMIVGEQPGEQEDAEGLPFVGPAGQVLMQVFRDIGFDRKDAYMTNAVKHFKFIQRGKKRLHQSPAAREINACKPWLTAEREIVKPRVILGLGLTAAKSLLGHGFAMKDQRGKVFEQDGAQVIISYHPSAILRAGDKRQRQELYTYLRDDSAKAVAAAFQAS